MNNRYSLAAHVAKKILQGSINSIKIGQMRIFESMADQFVDCSELVLLYKFYTFKRRLSEGELRQAIHLLHELFIDNSSPIEFHVTLAEEAARLLGAFQQELISTEAIDPNTVSKLIYFETENSFYKYTFCILVDINVFLGEFLLYILILVIPFDPHLLNSPLFLNFN